VSSLSVSHQASLEDLRSSDKERQNRGYTSLLQATREPVDWAYAIWDDLLQLLVAGDNRQRSIAAQVLSGLAKSDPKQRMVKDLGTLIEVTRDERFVTARHCLQSLWQVGIAGDLQRRALVKGLVQRFRECAAEKNCTLIRYDILAVLRRVDDLASGANLRPTAEMLITLEQDPKYRKKYQTLWRNAR
jgi:hypothetical protein